MSLQNTQNSHIGRILEIHQKFNTTYSCSHSYLHYLMINNIVNMAPMKEVIAYQDIDYWVYEGEFLGGCFNASFLKQIKEETKISKKEDDCGMGNLIILSADCNVSHIYGKWRNRRMDLVRKVEKRDKINEQNRDESELGAQTKQGVSSLLREVSEYNPNSNKYYLRAPNPKQSKTDKTSKQIYSVLLKDIALMLPKTSHDISSFFSGCENDWNESFLKFMSLAEGNQKRVRKYSELVRAVKKNQEKTLPGLKNITSIKLNFKKNNDPILAPKAFLKTNFIAQNIPSSKIRQETTQPCSKYIETTQSRQFTSEFNGNGKDFAGQQEIFYGEVCTEGCVKKSCESKGFGNIKISSISSANSPKKAIKTQKNAKLTLPSPQKSNVGSKNKIKIQNKPSKSSSTPKLNTKKSTFVNNQRKQQIIVSGISIRDRHSSLNRVGHQNQEICNAKGKKTMGSAREYLCQSPQSYVSKKLILNCKQKSSKLGNNLFQKAQEVRQNRVKIQLPVFKAGRQPITLWQAKPI